jgi:hypothetical protein
MLKIHTALLCLQVIASVLLVGCDFQEHSENKDNKPMEISFQPIYKEIASQYQYRTINTTRIEQEIDEHPMVVENKMDIITLFEISKNDPNGYTVQITYKEFGVKVEAGEIKKELQASTALNSIDPQEKIFAAFDNAVVEAELDSLGNVISVSGLDAIQNKMIQLAGNSKEAIQMIHTSLQQYLNEKNFKQNLAQNFKVFANKQIKIGDRWTINSMPVADFNTTFPLHYTFKEIKNNLGVIDVRGETNLKNQTLQLQGNTISVSLNGEQEGKIEVDVETGMVLQSHSKFKAKGNLTLYDKEVPMKIEAEVVVKGEKIL